MSGRGKCQVCCCSTSNRLGCLCQETPNPGLRAGPVFGDTLHSCERHFLFHGSAVPFSGRTGSREALGSRVSVRCCRRLCRRTLGIDVTAQSVPATCSACKWNSASMEQYQDGEGIFVTQRSQVWWPLVYILVRRSGTILIHFLANENLDDSSSHLSAFFFPSFHDS